MNTEKEPNTRANAAVTDATTIMDELLNLIDRLVPVHSYMAAENAAVLEEIREREQWGETAKHVRDLRNSRRDVMDAARELAEELAHLMTEVDRLTNTAADAEAQ